MAAMGFNKRTSSTMMNFIDDHKDSFSEGVYIEMCNAMQFLHKKAKKAPPIPFQQQSPVEELVSRLQEDEKLTKILDKHYNTMKSKGRINVNDKVSVLVDVKENIPEEFQYAATMFPIKDSIDVKFFMSFLNQINCLPENIQERFAKKRDSRMASEKNFTKKEIERKEEEKNTNHLELNNLIVKLVQGQVDKINAIYEAETDDEEDPVKMEIIDLTI